MCDAEPETSVKMSGPWQSLFLRLSPAVFLILSSLTVSLGGQETDSSEQANTSTSDETNQAPRARTYRISSGSIESWKVDETTRGVLLAGGAELKRSNERLTASRIIGWANTTPSEQGGPIPERLELTRVYAETDVLYWKEDEFLQADRLYLDLSRNTGIARNVTYRSYDRTRDVPVVVRANLLVQTGEGTYRASGVQFTTCDYADPHYNVYADSLDIWHNREDDETSVSATHVVPQFRGVPFGYWPFLHANSNFDLGPLKRVEYGSNDRFGNFVETLWGFEFSSVKRDAEGNVVRDKNGDKVLNYDLDLDLQLDYRERRGPAVGPEIDYKLGRNHEGFLNGYLMNDLDGPNPDNEFDRQFLPQQKDHRGRAWWFHRYDLIGTGGDVRQLRLDTEVNNVSDRHFMEEFFEDEFKTGKDRETYTYLRYVDGNEFGSFLTRYRLNSFQTQTEYFPGANYEVIGESIEETPLVYSSDTSIANLRRKRDRQSSRPDFRSGRFDTYQEVAYPLSLGPVQTRAFTGGRFSHYDNELGGNDDVSRHIFSGGAQVFDQLHRTFSLPDKPVGLDGLRHIFSWDVRYTNNFESNEEPTGLPRFDTRDPLGEHEEIFLELRNRFQTRSSSPNEDNDKSRSNKNSTAEEENGAPDARRDDKAENAKDNTHEFLSTGAAIEFYPDTHRDRQRVREQNHLTPASWITSVRSPATGEVRDDNLSLLHLDFEFTPKLPFSLSGDYETNLEEATLDASTTKIRIFPWEDVSTSLTHSYVRNLTETLDANVRAPLSDHWMLSGTLSYDLERSDSQDIQLGLGYRLHDFTVRFVAQFNDRRDDQEYAVSISPNFTGGEAFDFDVAEQ